MALSLSKGVGEPATSRAGARLPLDRLVSESVEMVRLRNVPLPEPFLVGLGVGAALHRLRPWRLPGSRPIQRFGGAILVASGMQLIMRAVQAAGSGTVEDPDRLLTTGPYALTRNPIHLG